MHPEIRKATLADMSAIHQLVVELAEYEKARDKVITTPESFAEDFTNGVFDAFVADDGGSVVGVALYYVAFSTWKGRMLYLDDFVVTDDLRGSGIGKQLFGAFMEEARRQKVSMVKWQVLDWNEPAIRFYKKYAETVFDAEWIDCKIYLK